MVLGFAANIFNRLKWTRNLPESEVVILHRGAPEDRKRIKGDHITEIKRGHFCHIDFETKKETHIPMHRVLEIWMDDGLVWKKRMEKKAKAVKFRKAVNPGGGVVKGSRKPAKAVKRARKAGRPKTMRKSGKNRNSGGRKKANAKKGAASLENAIRSIMAGAGR